MGTEHYRSQMTKSGRSNYQPKGEPFMSTILGPAKQFFEACETGKGWDVCKAYCSPGATFSSQTGALAEISTLEGYCDWMKDLFTPIPDGHYELKFFAANEADNSVAAFAVFHGTQTGQGGPVPPTNQTIAADYVYHMVFDGERIKHVTKIWNDSVSMQQLGWA
jgi:predicted ester cyclase